MKKIISLLITMLLVVCLTSCSANSKSNNTAGDTASASAEQTSAEVTQDVTQEGTTLPDISAQTVGYETKYGTVRYPAEYEDDFIIEEQEDEFSLTLTFSAEEDGDRYELFEVRISDESGDSLGTVTDAEDSKHNVFIDVNELDIDFLEQEQQDRLYSLQESVNVIVDNLG